MSVSSSSLRLCTCEGVYTHSWLWYQLSSLQLQPTANRVPTVHTHTHRTNRIPGKSSPPHTPWVAFAAQTRPTHSQTTKRQHSLVLLLCNWAQKKLLFNFFLHFLCVLTAQVLFSHVARVQPRIVVAVRLPTGVFDHAFAQHVAQFGFSTQFTHLHVFNVRHDPFAIIFDSSLASGNALFGHRHP